MKQSQAFKDWSSRLESGLFTHSQCRAWCRTVVATANGDGWYVQSSLTVPEASELRARMRIRGGVEITAKHADTGRAWLRKNERRLKLPAGIVDNIAGFRFMGDAENIGTVHRSHYIPVWRMFLTDGRTYDYAASAWQSGDTFNLRRVA